MPTRAGLGRAIDACLLLDPEETGSAIRATTIRWASMRRATGTAALSALLLLTALTLLVLLSPGKVRVGEIPRVAQATEVCW